MSNQINIWIPSIKDQKSLDKFLSEYFEKMEAFSLFNEKNQLQVKVYEPSDPELKDHKYAGFTPVPALLKKLPTWVTGAGDGPNNEVYVQLRSSDWYKVWNNEQRDIKSRDIRATTLGNHMIVGYRYWSISGSVSDKGAQINIMTSSMESRNGLRTDGAFWLFGAQLMSQVWDQYLLNIYSDITNNYSDAKWTTTSLGLAEVFLNDGEKTTPKENPWKEDRTFSARSEEEFKNRLRDLAKYQFKIFPNLASDNMFERLAKVPEIKYWSIPKEKIPDK